VLPHTQVSGQGQLLVKYPQQEPQQVATVVDVANLEQLMRDLFAEQQASSAAAQAALSDKIDAQVATLQAALDASNTQRDAFRSQLTALQQAVEVSAGALDDTETCQQALVDAVHNGAADEIEGCPDSVHTGGCTPYPVVDGGEALGHGNRKGAVRFIHCEDG
jgi:hypothetical protein